MGVTNRNGYTLTIKESGGIKNMKRTIKTISIIATMGVMLVCAYLLGTTQAETITEVQTVTEVKEVEKIVEVIPDGYINTKSEEFTENYVDMRKVVYFEVVDGLQLYYEDGTGYYWE